MSKWIEGFIHTDFDNAFFQTVELVSKYVSEHRAGVHVGYMEFTDGTFAEIYRHPGGTYYGHITDCMAVSI